MIENIFVLNTAYSIATLISLLLPFLYIEYKRIVVIALQVLIEAVLIGLAIVLQDFYALLWAGRLIFVVTLYVRARAKKQVVVKCSA